MKSILRLFLLVAIIFALAAFGPCQRIRPAGEGNPPPIEQPADCKCYVDPISGKTICNSACSPGAKKF